MDWSLISSILAVTFAVQFSVFGLVVWYTPARRQHNVWRIPLAVISFVLGVNAIVLQVFGPIPSDLNQPVALLLLNVA